jgi:DNA repair protein RadC
MDISIPGVTNAGDRVSENVDLFRGTMDGASAHSRRVVKRVLERRAAAVVLVHTHSSVVRDQNSADEAITHRLGDSLALIDVRDLVPGIIAAPDSFSFSAKRLL